MANDPYQVLGVSRNATDDEIKAAYRELAKKYHPDNYVNNPLADLAAQKMQEVNEAYDTIMNSRRSQSNSSNSGQQGYNPNAGSARFHDVRNMINQNRINEAEEVLNRVSEDSRNAEWFFLKGTIFYRRGWMDQALSYYARAVQMEPNNVEYSSAYNQLQYQHRTGTNPNYRGGYNTTPNASGCSICDCCTAYLCMDCLCDCCR